MDPAVLREDMVDGLDHALDGLDESLGVAMRTVPRHVFVEDRPYDNRAGDHAGTDVLAPRTVARLLEALDTGDEDDVLVVGVGVGYTAALLAELVGERRVHAVDIARRLVLDARRNLRQAGYEGVLVDRRDGANGLPEYAPFDRILVEAAAVRPPRALLDQLAPDGRLVMPMGTPDQTLVAVEADDSPEGYAVVEEFGSTTLAPLLVAGEEAGGVTRNRTEREDREFAEQGYFAPTGWEQNWIDWEDRLDGGRGHHRR
ncbi:protein-L-isoaspartate O-methyltransferase family protein [Haloplanus aerogenes]|uniref:protein-L-isoaspartate(D-aspartate) O-methyltransferase n=1 Tax=Haloplanus aerogenes TaxID=660522 RepID=A0A3M0CY60_9EURY|nr:methyltransferase domain-containing protein [Haloplanus aerogenes]AZH26936.1 methyltransferase domain-containing protein [Haloplanus aerogenes]RMB12589.1 protein-L-isoaspartate(D-aspartate) O-methyltransferase [Haloplanus aerogenes]